MREHLLSHLKLSIGTATDLLSTYKESQFRPSRCRKSSSFISRINNTQDYGKSRVMKSGHVSTPVQWERGGKEYGEGKCGRVGLQYVNYTALITSEQQLNSGRAQVNYTIRFLSQSASSHSEAEQCLTSLIHTTPQGNGATRTDTDYRLIP
jgi:hypothetical protein